tara:strand:+ start:315 stop:503 length:189 start_codon:yes stop_codon:yes gene_type:complete
MILINFYKNNERADGEFNYVPIKHAELTDVIVSYQVFKTGTVLLTVNDTYNIQLPNEHVQLA